MDELRTLGSIIFGAVAMMVIITRWGFRAGVIVWVTVVAGLATVLLASSLV